MDSASAHPAPSVAHPSADIITLDDGGGREICQEPWSHGLVPVAAFLGRQDSWATISEPSLHIRSSLER